jgi:hypothetical protein
VRLLEDVHLTYCTNIHPADGWAAVFQNLERHAPALKARFAPAAPFGIGLRLSARDAAELLSGDRLPAFRTWLDDHGLYVAIINGFPYGPFHGTPVKETVYAPDWRDPARARYTLDLLEVVRRTVPPGVDAGISTAPLSYKAWLGPTAGDEAWKTMVGTVVRVVEGMARVRDEGGPLVHLDIEPEPDCTIETTEETVRFFEERLLRQGAPVLARALGVSDASARERLLDHVRVCFDCCHFAVEFEEATQAFERLAAAGIRIGRVQLSSALDVRIPADPGAAREVTERLEAFADSTYLHQVVEASGGRVRRYPDLPPALAAAAASGAERHWRIHFHVPLFTREYGALGSTQAYVADVLRHVFRTRATRHLEIETYTWDVLPPALKLASLESIAREYEWVLGCVGAADGAGRDNGSASAPEARETTVPRNGATEATE